MADEPLEQPARPITRRMEQFCLEYLVDLNASRSAVRAGVPERSARNMGYRYLRDSRIQARIAELMKERESATRVKSFLILEELAIVATSRLDHYLINDQGEVTTRSNAPDGALGAISAIKRTAKVIPGIGTEYTVDLKFFDKNPAIANAMKHLGLLKDEVHHRDLTLEDLIREAADTPDAGNSAAT